MRTRTLTAICSGVTLAVLPVFLVAGLVPQIRDELALSETQVGLGITTALAVSAAVAIPAGRLSDRVGARTSIIIGSTLGVVSLVGLALLTASYSRLLLFLAISGLAIGFANTGFARLIASIVPSASRGFAFGVKEAAIPAASLAVGLAIPLLAVTLGWQSVAWVGVVPLVVLMLTFPRTEPKVEVVADPHRRTSDRRVQVSRPALAAVAAALATASAAGAKVFVTETAATVGMSASAAGVLLVVAGLFGVVARIAMGRRVDRRTGKAVPMTSTLMLVGCAAMVMGAIGWPLLLIPAAIGVFAGAAGWSGLFLYAMVESRPEAAGAAAGVGIAGVTVGGAVGPVVFGLAIEHSSLTVAWIGAAVLIGLASVIMTAAGRQARVSLAPNRVA